MQQEGVHGRERDAGGGQKVRHGKVYNQDISAKRESESDVRKITWIGFSHLIFSKKIINLPCAVKVTSFCQTKYQIEIEEN